MAEPRFGVVIPTRSRPDLLARALRSVREQRLAPVDVVVVHDEEAVPATWAEGGGDGVRHLATGGHRGASAARNLGVAAVEGSHLAFLDDDDRWKPDYLAEVAPRLAGVAFTVGQVERVRGDRVRVVRPMPLGLTGDDVLETSTGITCSGLTITRADFHAVGGFDEGLPAANDLDFLVRALDAGLAYAVVPGSLVEYHEHDGDRLTTSPRRGDGLDAFRAKWAARLSPVALRRMDAEVLGIRRRAVPGRLGRIPLALREGRLLGPRESLQRVSDLRRWSERPPSDG